MYTLKQKSLFRITILLQEGEIPLYIRIGWQLRPMYLLILMHLFSSFWLIQQIQHRQHIFSRNISISPNSHYQQHGRVYSTFSTREHFFNVCYKTIIYRINYLIRIDKLRLDKHTIMITSDMNKVRQIIKRCPGTVYVCYKKSSP